MTQKTYRLIGGLTTLAPLTVALKDCMRSRKHEMPKSANGNAFFPASSIRGAFRHAGFRLINSRQKKYHSEAFSLDESMMLSQGYFVNQDDEKKAQKSKSGISLEVDLGASVREQNPFLSLFGRWGLDGKLSVGSAYTEDKNDCLIYANGARGIYLERSPELLQDLSENDQGRFFDILRKESQVASENKDTGDQQRTLKKELKAAREAGDNEQMELLNQKIQELDSEKKQRKEDKGEATESIRRPLESFQAISQGVELEHRMKLNGVTETELGLFLAVLGYFSESAQLGGHAAQGFGLIEAEWKVKVWDEDTFTLKEIGTVTINDDGFVIKDNSSESSVLTNALEKWSAQKNLNYKKYI